MDMCIHVHGHIWYIFVCVIFKFVCVCEITSMQLQVWIDFCEQARCSRAAKLTGQQDLCKHVKYHRN
jgi:hypothetical protein